MFNSWQFIVLLILINVFFNNATNIVSAATATATAPPPPPPPATTTITITTESIFRPIVKPPTITVTGTTATFGVVSPPLLSSAHLRKQSRSNHGATAPTTTTTTTTTTTANGNNNVYLTKRNINTNDLSSSASAKNYEPKPEYYKGSFGTSRATQTPTSSSSSSASTAAGAAASTSSDSATASFLTNPIAFPNTQYGPQRDSYLTNEYNNWQLLRGGIAGPAQDRISVKHYGSPDHGLSSSSGYTTTSSSSYASSGGGAAGYGSHYDVRPSYYEYPASHSAGYGYSSSGLGSNGALPFDVYGHQKGHYGDSSYSYGYGSVGEDIQHDTAMHKAHPDWSQKALLAKSFLIPLASAAVLGIAAALVSNPLLLQLGTVGGGGVAAPALIGKRRRKRAALHEATKVMQNEMAYRGYK